MIDKQEYERRMAASDALLKQFTKLVSESLEVTAQELDLRREEEEILSKLSKNHKKQESAMRHRCNLDIQIGTLARELDKQI